MVLNTIKAACLLSVCTSLAACAESAPRPRIALVGSAAEQGHGAETRFDSGASTRLGSASASTAKFVVTAGNVLIGAAGANLGMSLDGTLSTAVVDGAVTGVLLTSGHTLVELSNGASVLLDGTGGKVGELVSIDVSRGQVIAGPGALVGSSALPSTPAGGRLVTSSGGAAANGTGSATAVPSSGSAADNITSTVTKTVGVSNLGCC